MTGLSTCSGRNARRAALALVGAALVGCCGQVQAAAFRVNSTVDQVDALPGDGVCEATPGAGDCTLRAAIQETNALVGDDDVSVSPGFYPLDLSGVDEDGSATGDLDIQGGLALTCEAVGECFVDAVQRDRCLHVLAGSQVVVDGFWLTNGSVAAGASINSDSGGLLLIEGAFVTLRSMTLTSARAERGGGIAALSASTLQCEGAKISDCTATLGGGVHVADSSALFVGSSVGNCVATSEGGGLAFERASVRFNAGTITANAALDGGGLAARDASVGSVEESTVSGNQAVFMGGGVLLDDAQLNLSAARCEDNVARDGAGIAMRSGQLDVLKSSVTGNVGSTGAGIWADGGTLTLLNSTIALNKASGVPNARGGGLLLASPGSAVALLSYSTITANISSRGGGIEVEAGLLTMATTILANNIAPVGADASAADGLFVSGGFNLVGDPAGIPAGALLPEDLVGLDPMLSSPSQGRGLSTGFAPRPGSPVVDAADPMSCAELSGQAVENDQHGELRPTDADSDGVPRCDIGAIEWCGEDFNGDGTGDRCGCVAGDLGSIVVPPEPLVLGARVDGFTHPLLTWTDLVPIAGTATTYEIAADDLDALWRGRAANAPCVLIGHREARWEDLAPLADDVYYLVRGVNACGPLLLQGWGEDSNGVARPACP